MREDKMGESSASCMLLTRILSRLSPLPTELVFPRLLSLFNETESFSVVKLRRSMFWRLEIGFA